MKTVLKYLIPLMICLAPILTGCESAFPGTRNTATPTITAQQDLAPSPTLAPTPTPTETPTPTLSPTPTLTPTPTLFALEGTPLPPALTPISLENAGQVSALAEWQMPMVNDMAWTPDSRLLAAATDDRIELYDVFTRQKIRSLYPQSQDIVSIAFGTDYFGSWLVSGSRWGSEQEGFGSALELWRGPDWQPRGILSASVRGLNEVTFSPTGKVLAAVYASPIASENMIEFLDTTSWTISSTLQAGSVLNIDFSPDAAFLATSPDRYSVNIWDINRRTLAYKFFTSFTGAVNSLAYSPDGAMLATSNYAGSIDLYDVKTGVLIRSIPTDSALASLAYSPDGSVLASGGAFQDSTVRLWSTATGELLRELEGHDQAVTQLLFSPDGQMIVSASYDGKIILWGIRP